MDPSAVSEYTQIAKLAGDNMSGMIMLIGMTMFFKYKNKKDEAERESRKTCENHYETNRKKSEDLEDRIDELERKLFKLEFVLQKLSEENKTKSKDSLNQ